MRKDACNRSCSPSPMGCQRRHLCASKSHRTRDTRSTAGSLEGHQILRKALLHFLHTAPPHHLCLGSSSQMAQLNPLQRIQSCIAACRRAAHLAERLHIPQRPSTLEPLLDRPTPWDAVAYPTAQYHERCHICASVCHHICRECTRGLIAGRAQQPWKWRRCQRLA